MTATASGANCTNISGATSSSYVLTSNDVGDTLRVVVTATSGGGSTPATSARTAVIQVIPAPANTTPPAISGTTTLGQTLSAAKGSWTGTPTSYSYQWRDCDTSGANCTNISGATSGSYVLTSNDVGGTLRVVVTATSGGGSTPATSAQTAVIQGLPAAPTNTTLPSISGTTTQGQTLTGAKGSWTGTPTSYSYQWRDCDTSGANCTNISGATSSTYTVTSNEVGDTLRVVVSATNSGGSTPATSSQTAIVQAPAVQPPANTAAPAISGTLTQGQSLTTGNGSWSGSPTSYSYKWQDCDSSGANCSNISGAASNTYALTANDVGHTIRAVVTAANAGGSTPATSAATAVVASSGSGSGSGGGSTQSNCINQLVTCGFPDPSSGNVGVPSGTKLTTVNGNVTLSTPGQVYSGFAVNGTITVSANNVTIKDVQVTCGGCSYGIQVGSSTGTLVEDSTVSGTNSGCGRVAEAIGNNGITVERVYVYYAATAVNGGNDDISDSYLITNAYCSGDHTEPILAADGNDHETINHNVLLNPNNQTADIDAGGPWGPLVNVSITNNIMAGGDYPLEIGCPGDKASNIVIKNNRITRVYFANGGQYGVSGVDPNNTSWSNNFWDDTLGQISMSPGGSGCPVG